MPNYVPQTASEACRCGRLNTRVHCPRCGVYSVYAFSRKRDESITDKTGDLVKVQVYECRRCRNVFNDVTWREACNAPRSVTLGEIGKAQHITNSKTSTGLKSLNPIRDADELTMTLERLKRERGY